jgi:hypothetical protein
LPRPAPHRLVLRCRRLRELKKDNETVYMHEPFLVWVVTWIVGGREDTDRCKGRFILALSLVLGTPLPAPAQTIATSKKMDDPRLSVCQLIEATAHANALPVDFFARVIWQESRFQPDARGPLTRSGERAEGIAQFMPDTAAEHRLLEPFNPVEALPKSGEFLAELRDEFRNLGLAAAAYNAGPQRVRDFLSGTRELPEETRHYVRAITGRPVEDWVMPANKYVENKNEPQASSISVNCHDLVESLERNSNSFASQWRGHNVPSWCRAVHHPNVTVCGLVHLVAPSL